jgi:hypothetical protein
MKVVSCLLISILLSSCAVPSAGPLILTKEDMRLKRKPYSDCECYHEDVRVTYQK